MLRFSCKNVDHSIVYYNKKLNNLRGTWVAQLVKCQTLGLGSSHDLRVVRLSPKLGSALSRELASLSLSLSPFLTAVCPPAPQILFYLFERERVCAQAGGRGRILGS